MSDNLPARQTTAIDIQVYEDEATTYHIYPTPVLDVGGGGGGGGGGDAGGCGCALIVVLVLIGALYNFLHAPPAPVTPHPANQIRPFREKRQSLFDDLADANEDRDENHANPGTP